MPRCDLQVHSAFSDRPSEWVLRKLGVPESYTRPRDLYQRLKKDGFDWITITDHNRIEGGLEIADLPGVFLSEEVTTYFPEDGCKIHLLVWNLNEAQHREILSLRSNIYELAGYLRREGLVHGVAHPLLSINQKLTVEHFEKLILLFRVFEGLNGTQEPYAQQVVTLCLRQLTREQVEAMADRHGIEPTHERPWQKSLTGGSDDHGGLYPGRAWTEVQEAVSSAADFLKHVEAGHCQPMGAPGNALCFANSIYRVILSYVSDRMSRRAPRTMGLLKAMVDRFFAGENPTAFSLGERIAHIREAVISGRALELLNPNDASINKQFAMYFTNPRVRQELDAIVARESTAERRTFRMASKITNDLAFRLFDQFMMRIHRGELAESLESLSGFIPLAAAVTPYVFSFHALHGNRPFLERTARAFLPELPPFLHNTRRAWFTDTLEDVNGVARTIRALSLSAKKAGADLTVVTSRSEISIHDIPIKNFEPVGEFELPEYKLQKLSFPPILEMLEFIERERFTECIISTPGPVGLVALMAAKLLGLRTSAIYHTDFPQYVRILSEDEMLETMMWQYMHWFYSQVDLVYVNSKFYRDCWVERGIAESKIDILPRGLDTELFNCKHRDETYWKRRGARGPVMLYVGRISKEKELEFLADVFVELKRRGVEVSLAVVGEGPYREEMARKIPQAIFTGILTGQELGVAYASADMFVFPSTTDTFGNVVIEAIAAGLPVLVSDVGGPAELIKSPTQGRVLPARDLEAWVAAVEEWVRSPIERRVSLEHAHAMQADHSWDEAFARFWARTAN